MKSEKTKEKIIKHTIELIQKSDGNPEDITMRRIAKRAEVGVGLINHYFRSKDDLIEVCIQSIISEVIYSFRPGLSDNSDPLEMTKAVAKQVMDFLMENKQISKISILGDLKQPEVMDNTMKTVRGFANSLSGGTVESRHVLNSFMITAVLQEAFLRKEILKDCLGVDFNNKEQRDNFIDSIIERFGGT